jgi:hypothetical protein
MDDVVVELLIVPECPNEAAAVDVLARALDDVGLGSAGYAVTFIHSHDDAERRHFVGSPTICVDGADVFPDPGRPASVACRIYPGGTGVPELRDLRKALKRAAALSMSR